MWGPSIIGFGRYHYKYASGHEGDAPLAAFSPRKDSLVVYIATDFKKREELLSQLGKHKSSKSCVYAKKLDDIDMAVLEKMIRNSMSYTTKLYPLKISTSHNGAPRRNGSALCQFHIFYALCRPELKS